MRDYGTVPTQFWVHAVYSKLSINAKLLAVYLLTCPHANMLGCFRLPKEYIAVDLSIDKTIIHHALEELMEVNFLSMDVEQGWVLIHPFLEWNPIENGNQAKHIIRLFEKTSSYLKIYPKLVEILETLSAQFDEVFQNRLQTLSKEFQNPSETLSKPFPTQKQEQEQDQEQRQNQENVSAAQKNLTSLSEAIITIPLNSGSEYPIYDTQIAEWKSLYPAIDILQALRNIRGWNLSNPKKRKTKSGILQHINTWLAKEQNTILNSAFTANNRGPPSRPQSNLEEYNARVAEEWIRESEVEIIEGEMVK